MMEIASDRSLQTDILKDRRLTPETNPQPFPLSPISSSIRGTGKPKKQPTVTPRTFVRFFTPRSCLKPRKKSGTSRQILRDITAAASNCDPRVQGRLPSKATANAFEDAQGSFGNTSKKRKRNRTVSPDTTPDRSSPIKRTRDQICKHIISSNPQTDSDDESLENDFGEDDSFRRFKACFPKSRAHSRQRGLLESVLSREVGQPRAIQRYGSIFQYKGWQTETSNFSATPEDTHVCYNIASPQDEAIPFCTASCNTNSLVAIGDEEGGVRLLETANDGKSDFSKPYLTFRPHANAILDLAFSQDDLLLATASGDQTAQVIDMPTQSPIYSLAGHISSVKQARFQPGNSNVIATSSRDGSIQIWDLRCKGSQRPARNINVSLDASDDMTTLNSAEKKLTWARAVNIMYNAHVNRSHNPAATSNHTLASARDAPSKTESPSRRGDVSITALSFLHPGREHLFITASEANASVKLWDIRVTQNYRRGNAMPLSTTRQPDSHTRHRNFGLTSMVLSGKGDRFYTVCRDSTVYAYSTSHLILGHAPELASASSRPRRSGRSEKEGLGPIYGFRHSNFHATTFYVKCALRPAASEKSEMLAVGSSDNCMVLFPTDERYIQRSDKGLMESSFQSSQRISLRRTNSSTSLSTRLNDTIPIYQHGSALVRGHSREVTGCTWTLGGELISVGDDFRARCWREENREKAKDLRVKGEGEGRRWGCGWAEVESQWDEEDG